MKYLGKNNLTKYVQDPHPENYKTLMKEIKHQNKQRDKPYSFTGRLNIVTMSVSPNLIYRCDAFPINIPAGFFVDINKPDLKKFLKSKSPTENQNNQHNFEK